jgi:hypothetical protein
VDRRVQEAAAALAQILAQMREAKIAWSRLAQSIIAGFTYQMPIYRTIIKLTEKIIIEFCRLTNAPSAATPVALGRCRAGSDQTRGA